MSATCCDLQSGSPAGNGGPGCAAGSLTLTVGVVEVAEHLPFPSMSPASSAASSLGAGGSGGASSWLPAEEMARVPAVLPSAKHTQWPTPTSAGQAAAVSLPPIARLACRPAVASVIRVLKPAYTAALGRVHRWDFYVRT